MYALPARPTAPSARFPTSTPMLEYRINGNAISAYPASSLTMGTALLLARLVRLFQATERPAPVSLPNSRRFCTHADGYLQPAPTDAQPASAAQPSVRLVLLASSPSTDNASPPARPTLSLQMDPAPPAIQTAQPAQDLASTNARAARPTFPCSQAPAAASLLAARPSTSTPRPARVSRATHPAARALPVARPGA
jgi:hypothetical protein